MRARILSLAVLSTVAALALTAGPALAAFPGQNGRIAYGSEPPGGGPGVLWTVNPDGGGRQQLTTGPWDREPAYSADGTRLAFMREGNLVVMGSDGSGLTRLFEGSYDGDTGVTWEEDFEDPETEAIIPNVRIDAYEETWDEVDEPAFSPDGSSLVGVRYQGSFRESYVCAVESGGDEDCIASGQPGYFSDSYYECSCGADLVSIDSTSGAILGNPAPAASLEDPHDPTYSSDGKLAFTAREEGTPESLYVVRSPGATPEVVLSGFGDSADFSPDGSTLVALAPLDENLLLIGAAGGGVISTIPVPPLPEVESVELADPKYSPDGTRIAFEYEGERETGPNLERVFTIGLDGGGLTKVLDDDAEIAWQPLQATPPTPPAKPAAPVAVSASVIAKKGRVNLDHKGRGTVGWVVCGTAACAPKVLAAKLKVGKRKFSVKVSAPKQVAAGKRAKLRVRVKGKALAALKAKGKGKLVTRVRAEAGQKAGTLRSTLVTKRGKAAKRR